MTSKHLAEKIRRRHENELARQRQRAARRPSASQKDTNRIGIALCRAMLRSAEVHREAQQSGST